MKKTMMLFLALLSLSSSAAAQDRLDQEQQKELGPEQILIQVQWLLTLDSAQRGTVSDLTNNSAVTIGQWYDLPLFQGTPRQCPPYCRPIPGSRIYYFHIQALVSIPGKGNAFCDLAVEVDKSRIMRTGLPTLAGRVVPVFAVDESAWSVVGGTGWLVQDDNRQWRLSVTLMEPK